jgi:ABC-type nitrate/sulfonate/bicarbonate transport system substrate-binding protein
MRATTRAIRLVCGSILTLGVWFASPNGWAADDGFIRFTTDTASISLPLWYAEEKGLFEKHGLKYTDTPVNAAFLGLQAIGAGTNDASVQSDPPTISNIAAGIDAVIVAVVAKGEKSMALVAKSSVKSVADLKGKKVVWLKGSGGELGFAKYLEARGLKLADFEHVNLPPAEAVPTLLSGGADALWFWQPWPRKALGAKPSDLHVIEVSTAKDYEPNMILTVSRTFAADKPQTLKKFLAVLIESVDGLKRNPDVGIDILMRRLRMPLDDAKLTLGDYPPDISLTGDFIKELSAIAALKSADGSLKSSPDWIKKVDASFLRAVAPEKVKNVP